MSAIGNVGKITEITNVAAGQNLSGGQIAAIILCLGLAIFFGWAGYAIYKDKKRDGRDSHGGETRIGRLRRALGGGRKKKQAVPTSEPKGDPDADDSDAEASVGLAGRRR